MASSLVSLALAVAMASTGGLFHRQGGGRVLPPGPGYGWGFPNGNPDGYGWVDYGTYLPLGADRTPDYYFPRHFASPPVQMIFPTYYNPYVTRGQLYIPYAGCGGCHPLGAPWARGGRDVMPEHPYLESINTRPVVPPPTYTGNAEARPAGDGGGATP